MPAVAQNYTFTNIADTSGPFSSFIGIFGGPRLNNSGTVSFIAQLDVGSFGVYRSDGVTTATIADTSGPYVGGSSSSFFTADINDAGQVAFFAVSTAFGRGIFRGDGVTAETIILERELPFDSQKLLDEGEPAAINNFGVVAFYARGEAATAVDGIFVGNGGNITLVSTVPFHHSVSPAINNLGQVAYTYDVVLSTENGIRIGNGATSSLVINNSGPYSSFHMPNLNDNNVVAAAAFNDDSGMSVLKIDGGVVEVVAGPFTTASDVGINNAGDVAFMAQTSTNVYSILTGSDPIADKVIGDGDALFGSTATLLRGITTIDGPNELGQIAFRYSLADGRQGVALATPNAALAGDYNHDDAVDVADYAVWRDTFGGVGAGLAADGNCNDEVDAGDYNFWRARFGNSTGSGNGQLAGIPEPTTLVLLTLGLVITALNAKAANFLVEKSHSCCYSVRTYKNVIAAH